VRAARNKPSAGEKSAMAFKKKDDQARSEVLDQFAQEAQELGLGY